VTLPNAAQAAVDDNGHFHPSWRNWLAALERTVSQTRGDGTDAAASIAAIATALGSPDGTVAHIPDQNWLSAFDIVSPDGTLRVTGSPASGSVQIALRALSDSGVGAALVKLTRDAFGRIAGTQSATTSDLAEGANLYFTDERAQDAVAAMIAAGTHTGITFTYNDAANSLSATVTGASTDIRDVWLMG